jgi:hypothetical protein
VWSCAWSTPCGVRRYCLTTGGDRVSVQCLNPAQLDATPGLASNAWQPKRWPISRDFVTPRDLYVLLAMQKVVGSNPISRSQKACICRPFLRAQSACASASGRTDSGLAAGRSSAVRRKTHCVQVDSGSSEPKSFCGPAEGRVFGPLRPLPRLLRQRTILRTAPAGAIPAVAVLGASPVSVRKPRGQPRPAPRPGEPRPAEPGAFS